MDNSADSASNFNPNETVTQYRQPPRRQRPRTCNSTGSTTLENTNMLLRYLNESQHVTDTGETFGDEKTLCPVPGQFNSAFLAEDLCTNTSLGRPNLAECLPADRNNIPSMCELDNDDYSVDGESLCHGSLSTGAEMMSDMLSVSDAGEYQYLSYSRENCSTDIENPGMHVSLHEELEQYLNGFTISTNPTEDPRCTTSNVILCSSNGDNINGQGQVALNKFSDTRIKDVEGFGSDNVPNTSPDKSCDFDSNNCGRNSSGSSSVSSTEALLRKLPTRRDTDDDDVTCLVADDTADNVSASNSKVQAIENLGKLLLSKTLDQVKKSLEQLTPSPTESALRFGSLSGSNLQHNKLSDVYIKNLVILSVSFLLIFTAFLSLRNLQSSLYDDGTLGLVSLACTSGVYVCSCFLTASFVHRMCPKRTMLFAMGGNVVFIIANVYPTWYTLIPASAMLGFGLASLWVSQGTYLTSLAVTYAAITQKKPENIISIFNGFFLFCHHVAQILGNLISSAVLNFGFFGSGGIENAEYVYKIESETAVALVNVSTKNIGGDDLAFVNGQHNVVFVESSPAPNMLWNNVSINSVLDPVYCGSTYCHSIPIDHKLRLSDSSVPMLLGIYLGLTLLGMLVLGLGLTKLDVIFHRKKQTSRDQVLGVARLHRDPRLLLLVPLTLYLGLQEAYMYSEVTKAFITCPLGLHMIGFVMMCYGACDSVSAFLCGHVHKYIHRKIVLTINGFLHISLLLVIVFWQPDGTKPYWIFLLCGGLGVCDGIWNTSICTLFGCLFTHNREAAFATLRMYEGLGFTVAFGVAPLLCMDAKTYILAGLLLLSLLTYHVMEYVEEKRKIESIKSPVLV